MAPSLTSVDLPPLRSSDIHLRAILQGMPQPSITKISLKITYLKFQLNELKYTVWYRRIKVGFLKKKNTHKDTH